MPRFRVGGLDQIKGMHLEFVLVALLLLFLQQLFGQLRFPASKIRHDDLFVIACVFRVNLLDHDGNRIDGPGLDLMSKAIVVFLKELWIFLEAGKRLVGGRGI